MSERKRDQPPTIIYLNGKGKYYFLQLRQDETDSFWNWYQRIKKERPARQSMES